MMCRMDDDDAGVGGAVRSLHDEAVGMLRSGMRARGWGRVELAGAVGVSPQAVDALLSGRRGTMTLGTLERYAAALGLLVRLECEVLVG
jgi:transcriptional regulator with XRE-family HTH domain